MPTHMDSALSLAVLNAAFARGINVKSGPYNAKGDGTTDDTTAIQNALNAVASTGGFLYFPVGTYKITAPLTIAGPAETDGWQGGGVALVGESARNTVLNATHAGILLDYSPNLSAFCGVEKMTLLGPGKATAGSAAMDCYQTPHLWVDQVMIQGFETGVQSYDCTGWTWTDVRVWYCGTGIKLGYNSDSMNFFDCEFRNSDLGVLMGWATGSYTGDSQFLTGIRFPGSIIAYNTLGFRLADKTASGVVFDGTYWEGNTKDGEIGVSGRSDTTGPTGPMFVGCFFSATTSPPRPVAIDVYSRPSIQMVNCSTDGANRYTVFVKMNDINGGSCVMEDCDIQAGTAALQVGSRNWNTSGGGKREGIRWGRKRADYIDTVNVPASVPLKELRTYNASNRVFESWGRYTLSDALVNEFRMTDVNGVLQVGGGSTSAFITATSVASLPTASANYRGCFAYVPGNGTTTADTTYVCLMSATGTYSWKQIVGG